MLKAFIVLVFIFLINIPSIYYDWYITWPWFDMVLHFSGGFFMAMFMWHWLKGYLGKNWFKNIIILSGVVALVGISWEFLEYFGNQFLVEPIYEAFELRVYFIGDLNDTLIDLFLDTSGAIIYFILHTLRRRKSH